MSKTKKFEPEFERPWTSHLAAGFAMISLLVCGIYFVHAAITYYFHMPKAEQPIQFENNVWVNGRCASADCVMLYKGPNAPAGAHAGDFWIKTDPCGPMLYSYVLFTLAQPTGEPDGYWQLANDTWLRIVADGH